jgi:hypothetical protein
VHLIRTFLQTSTLASIVLTSLSIYSNPASAQQRVCVITDEGSTVCGKLTTQTKKPNLPSGYRKEVDKFVFLLKGCSKSDTIVKCTVQITNKGEERKLIARTNTPGSTSGSHLVDSMGKYRTASTIEMGGNVSVSYVSDVSAVISTGIDYVADLTFKDVPEQMTQVPILNFVTDKGRIQFRNIPFSN